MRFLNLKKKFPSLRVGVLVIAAFALLGLMMLPSVSEKMGLNGSLLLAEYGYEYECDWVDIAEEFFAVVEDEGDREEAAFTEMLDCIDDCDTRLERVLSVFEAYCGDNETCYEVFEDSAERLYLEKASECVEDWLD